MVVLVDISTGPTVNLYLGVPVTMAPDGWKWGEHQRFPGVLAREYAYSAHEVRAVARTYGITLSRIIRPCEADQFCIAMYTTGLLVCRHQWEWNPHAHTYISCGEPWCCWPGACRRGT